MRNAILYRILGFILLVLTFQIVPAQQIKVKGRVSNATEVLPAATISLNNKTTLSNSKGEFDFSIGTGTYILTITYAGYKKMEKEIIITDHNPNYYFDFILQPSDELENFVVLGSRAGQRSNLSTPVPVDRIELSKLPARQVEVTKIIENTVPSFHATPLGFREGRQTVPISLRGLGPDRTLGLLNGRRIHSMAAPWTFGILGFGAVGVDLNAIPFASIETIEVLRDGASAQYGSDAIAGVINLQLNKSTGITSIQLRAGQYYKGDGESFSFSINRGFVLVNKDLPANKQGFLNFTAQTRFNNYTQRNGVYDGTVYYNIPRNAPSALRDSLRALDDQKIAERKFSRENHRPIGDNRVWNTGISVNGGYPVNTKTSLDWAVIWNYRVCKDISSNVYRYPKDSPRMVNTQLYPDGFLPYMKPRMPDLSVTGGLNGITGSGWKWDAGIIYGRNSITMDVFNSNNATQYLSGKDAQTSFYTGKQIFSQLTENINFSRELYTKSNTIRSLNLAFGTELRIENYQIKEGEEASWKNYAPTSGRIAGAQGQAGFQPENVINRGRHVGSVYAEVETEQVKKLLLNLATRYEYYSDFGSNLAGKIALRYKFSKHFLWRASISNGFRAPALQQKYYSLITSVTRPNGVLARTVTFTNENAVTKEFGIPDLEAEKSINICTGFTSTITNDISITFDAYWIQIKDRIIYGGNIPDSIVQVRNILDKFNYQDVQSVRFFSNAISTRTKGFDIIFTGRWKFHKSFLETSLAANFNQTELYDTILYAKNLPDREDYRNLLVNREERNRVEDAFPGNKIILNVIFTTGKWKTNLNLARYGSVNQKANDPIVNPDETLSPKIVTNLNIGYQLKSWITITAGAENLFDVYPDKVKYPANSVSGLILYNPNFAPFGCNGGYYFMNMSIKL